MALHRLRLRPRPVAGLLVEGGEEVLVEQAEEGGGRVDAEPELLVRLTEELPRRLPGAHQRPVEVEQERLELGHGVGPGCSQPAWAVSVSRPRKSCVSPMPVLPS